MKNRMINLAIGPLLFAACCTLLPQSVFASLGARAAVGTVLWMAYWWVTAPVDYAVTALLPIAVNAFIVMAKMPEVIANYSSETILLLLGASILTASWEETGLDRRIASGFLGLVGNNLRIQLIFWFIMSALLSAILPNAVVCATITPIAVSMLKYIGEGDVAKSRIGSKLLLTIAYAAGVGGLATPLGGAMNLVTVDYLQRLTGHEYMYIRWVYLFAPIMLILVVSNILFMLRDVKKEDNLGNSREFFISEYRKLPPISFEEVASLCMFLVATLLAFTRPLYQGVLPFLKPAYVFICCAILSFTIVRKDGRKLMVWKSVQGKIVWELMYIFAGGLAAGTLINKSGAAAGISKFVANSGIQNEFLLIFVIIMLTLILSDVTSNTATAAVAMPIVISIAEGMGRNPIPYVYVASIGVNLSYMLPTSIRAIPVGYGLRPVYMLKEGWKITVMVIILMTVTAWLLVRYWSAFQIA